MVRQKCFLCKVEAGKAGSEGISFHRLPANEKQREKWISFLELTEIKPAALIDWKCKTKAKASKIKQEIVKTGEGPANYVPLSDAEKRLLSLMGTKSVQGDDVCEMGFLQVSTS
ncbi:unnamed protein product [Acanthoscelides obtectus]|uniref:THAP-type domain-containing protein n=1 Tax=Acanthoscelides obtectus TaxID=200917 RepID=A0A9P0LM18_ACAOB|nr:unnamed protein product [Acanthoscelides obtectus]CAK1681163.1 hypothetical protein AOBTE_LOCUS33042 [Acanthoscelides obtectus]